MVPRWAILDEMVYELGSLRATIQKAEGRPDLAGADVTVALRASLARAADDIHLVIGSDDQAVVSQARRSIASAQEAGRRAQSALDGTKAVRDQSRSLRTQAAAAQVEAKRQIARLQDLARRTKPG